MGLYINLPEMGAFGKAGPIISNPEAKAKVLIKPEYTDPNTGRVTVCIVRNASFEAAAVAYSKDEYDRFLEPDSRPRLWLTVDLDWLKKACPEDWAFYL